MDTRGIFRGLRAWRATARPRGRGVLVALAGLLALSSGGAASAGSTAYVRGIDVSHWQGQPDWDAVRADGIRFAFAKATEGRTFVDERYAANRTNADAASIAIGAYHFARPDGAANDAIREADHFLDNAALKARHLLPVLDLEEHGGLGARALKRWAKAWLSRVEDRLGVKAIIYTFPSFWRDKMGNSTWFADNGHPLWIAHWGADQPMVPAQNWGGHGWTVWQHDDCGSVAGIKGCVDRNRLAAGSTIGALRIGNN